MKIYFVRHGQTDTNTAMRDGQTVEELNAPLNVTGREQAETLSKQLKDIKFDVIISSPLKRALQTAEIINKYHKMSIEIEESISERHAGKINNENWHDLFDFDKNIQPEDGESLSTFFDRVHKYFNNLKQKHTDKTVMIVSHGGVHHALYALSNNLPRKGNVRISPMHNCEFREYEL
ncbi:MAG: histidine phosphatase family protein [Candidatus Saccharibacteria bacterium]